MGGIIILIGLVAGLLISYWDWRIAAWVLGFALIGFTDDYIVPKMDKSKRGLGWKQKIVAQVVLAVLTVPAFHLHWDPWTIAVTAFLVLFFSNAYNFADGLDAMAGTLGLILCVGFLLLSCYIIEPFPHKALIALIGAYIPFLFLNAPPAKVFMGDVGSLPLGALFGVSASILILGHLAHVEDTAIQIGPSAQLWLPVIILGFVMIAELVPVPMQVGYYKLTKKRIFPMTPIHHSFEVKGWPESRVVWSFILSQLVLMLLAAGVAAVLNKGALG